MTKIRVSYVVLDYIAGVENANTLINELYSMTGWCESLVTEGCEVNVFIRFPVDDKIEFNSVSYTFVSDSYSECLASWQMPHKLHRKVLDSKATIIFGHDMGKMFQHRVLAQALRRKNIPYVIQNHAERPRAGLSGAFVSRLVAMLQSWCLHSVSYFLFCAPCQEDVWLRKKIIKSRQKVWFSMEGSTKFLTHSRSSARSTTGLQGNPVFLWVGNLDANKDPLTVLDGFEVILKSHPRARLYMVYRAAPLLHPTVSRIAASDALTKAVKLLGSKKRDELENLYNSADYFISGSHREGSGYSVMEAMACGVIPLVTTIPSFRMMLGINDCGALWECGDSSSLVDATLRLLSSPIEIESKKTRASFEARLSYPAIAKQIRRHIEESCCTNRDGY
jgi:glycosyltransferase involved in cell wall biosynthesis